MTWGSVHHHPRVIAPHPVTDGRKRRMCHCGCRKKETHIGTCNGVGLISGCELTVRRWVRDWQEPGRVEERMRNSKERDDAKK